MEHSPKTLLDLQRIITPSKYSHILGSYHLKHVYEKLTGEYIDDDDFIILLRQNGYRLDKRNRVYGRKTELAKLLYP